MRASSCLCSSCVPQMNSHRSHAVTVSIQRGLGGLAQLRIVGEAEIVVGAEIEQPPAIGPPISADCMVEMTRSLL